VFRRLFHWLQGYQLGPGVIRPDGAVAGS